MLDYKRILATISFLTILAAAYGQSKVTISSKLPTEVSICGAQKEVEMSVHNITTSTVSGIWIKVNLPNGVNYVSGSISGTNVTEKSITNLQAPEFYLPDLTIAQGSTFVFKIRSDCDLETFLTSGGIPKINATCNYTGGSVTHTSNPFNVFQPSVNITGITNQYYNGNFGEVFIRQITIKNSGKGEVSGFTIKQTPETGLKMLGINGGNTSVLGTVFTTVFDSTQFKNMGNGDVYFSQNEVITLVDTIKIIACSKLNAYMSLQWGCNSKNCKTTNYSTQVNLINKAPLLKYIVKTANNNCFDGSSNKQQLILVNAGNDTARNVQISIYQSTSSTFTANVLSSLDTSSIYYSIGKNGTPKKLKPTSTKLNSVSGIYSCLGNFPIGAFDVVLPFVLKSDSIYISWNSVSCCPASCNAAFYAHRWNYEASYYDQCGKAIKQLSTVASAGLLHSLSFSAFTPTDIKENDTLKWVFTVTNGTLVGNSAYSQLDVVFEIPKGLRHSLQKKDFRFENHSGGIWQPNSITTVGDSIVAHFTGVPSISLVRSELIVRFIGDCAGSAVSKDKNYTISFDYIPDGRCTNACVLKSLCQTGTIRIHCGNTCSGGLKFRNFEANRISFGLPDNDNDGSPDASASLDLDKIKRERLMFGDTLLTKFNGKISSYGSTTSWSRLTASTFIPYGRYLSVSNVTIRIFRNGNQLYKCSNVPYTYAASGNDRIATFDLSAASLKTSGCPLYTGFAYMPTDSVELLVKYAVSINPGNFMQEIELKNSFYLHTVANPTAAQRYQCDTFSGKIVLAGYYFLNYTKNSVNATGCNEFELYQAYYLSVGACCSNYAGGNLFPYEYRAWAKPQNFKVSTPKGFDMIHARMYHYRTTGTGNTAYQYLDTITPSSISGDTTTFNVGQLFDDAGGTLKISDDGFYGYLYCKFRPNCEAQEGKNQVDYTFDFKRLNYLGNGLETIHSNGVHSDDIYQSNPQISITALNDFINADSDTAVWQITVSNSSSVANAKNVWLYPESNGNTQVHKIIDLSTNLAIQKSNDIYLIGDFGIGTSKTFLIKATFKSCATDSFKLSLGYNCSDYPDSFSVAQCTSLDKILRYTPQNTRLEIEIVNTDSVIQLCSENYYDLKIKNLGNASVFNLYVDVHSRDGMIFNDTAYLFLNSTDSILVNNPVDLGNGIIRWNISNFSTLLINKGLSGISSNTLSEVTLRLKLSTNCDFVSSSYYLARPGGNLNCGKPVLSSFGVSKPIDIMGVSKPYYGFVVFDKQPIDACNYDGLSTAHFINLGPDTTGNTDYIQLILPKGFYLDTTFKSNIHNAPSQNPKLKQGKNLIGQWKIPAGILPGDSVVFGYKTVLNSAEVECGNTQLIMQSVVSQPALCVKDSSLCNIDVSTANDLMIDSINKGIYDVNWGIASSVQSGNNELVTLNYVLKNIGSDKSAGVPLLVKMVVDANKNNQIDSADMLISTDTIWNQIQKNQSITRLINFEANPANICNLWLVIDSTGCVCSEFYKKLPIIHLKNAGRDTLSCPETNIAIGSNNSKSYTYKWLSSYGIAQVDSGLTVFNGNNFSNKDTSFNLILQSDRGGGCLSKDTAIITLHPSIVLSMNPVEEICQNQSVIIGNLATGGIGIKTYRWSPTDSLSNVNGSKTIAKPLATTTYFLRVEDTKKCVHTDSVKVVVHQNPKADFVFGDTCVGQNYSFKNLSTSAGAILDSIDWHFDNGIHFSNQTPAFFPVSDTSQKLTLFVRDSFGCVDSTTKFINPYSLPIPNFLPQNGCQFDSLFVQDLTKIKTGSFFNSWNINNNVYQTQNLSVLAVDFGKYDVKLISTSDRGCVDSITKTIEVFEKPILEIDAQNACLGLKTDFAIKSSFISSDSVVQCFWKFGDGVGVASQKDTIHRYANEGLYSAEVYGITNNGCRDTVTKNIEIFPIPVADFYADTVCFGDSTHFFSTSTVVSGGVSSLDWNVGSGFFRDSATMSKKFNQFGVFPVSLIAETDHGCRDSFSKNVKIHFSEKPFLVVNGHCTEAPILLKHQSNFLDSILSVEWKIDANATVIADSIIQQFLLSGNHTVYQNILFNNGCRADSNFTIKVDDTPIADFNFNLPCADNLVDFNSTSSTKTGFIINNLWNLGDGNNENTAQFNHSYTNAGIYSVQLSIENNFGCKDTMQKTVQIDSIIIPDFQIKDICALDSQLIFEKSMFRRQNISKIQWNLGDGTILNGRDSLEYAYKNGGNYTVKLSFTTNQGCDYWVEKSVVVYQLPISDFEISPEKIDIVHNQISVISTAQGATDFEYYISDGASFSSPDFEYSLLDTGYFTITQKVTNSFGCTDISEKRVYVNYLINIFIPNAFHPNNDGKNEYFEPQGMGISTYELQIFNRWGEQIFYSEKGEAWDGKNAPTGAYFYVLRLTDFRGVPHNYSGIIHLIR
ncbi:MAG: gliding motility-associated C-terminal domain-containing protein [Flavobacteriales bacterium]|nr:gliding motility-associated C-terminal domain-containing protein [Flavobacteriales bacterium]